MIASAGRTIVITGASSGIGRELALQLAAPGTALWLIGRDKTRLAEVAALARAAGASARICAMDLADLDASGRWLEQTFPEGVNIDEVYLGAAVSLFGEVRDMLMEDWDLLYHTDLASPLQWADFFYKRMRLRKRGRIILIGSLAAYAGYPTATAYATMKAGLLGYFKSVRPEAECHGVSLHHAAPGYVKTGIYKAATYRNSSLEKVIEDIDNLGFKMIPAGTAAAAIRRGVDRDQAEFAFPAYASCMKWFSPRLPCLIGLVHAKIVNSFRKVS